MAAVTARIAFNNAIAIAVPPAATTAACTSTISSLILVTSSVSSEIISASIPSSSRFSTSTSYISSLQAPIPIPNIYAAYSLVIISKSLASLSNVIWYFTPSTKVLTTVSSPVFSFIVIL